MSERFFDPDDLAEAVLKARREPAIAGIDESDCFGEISDNGIRRLIRIAYYTSQIPNEGRFPRFTLVVPAKRNALYPIIALREQLTVQFLRRVSPILAGKEYLLLVNEVDSNLLIVGIAVSIGVLLLPQKGLTIQIIGPGELRAGEHRRHRLQAGFLDQEFSLRYQPWFKKWAEEAAFNLVKKEGLTVSSEELVKTVWLDVLTTTARLHHGACFAILSSPQDAPIQHACCPTEGGIARAIEEYWRVSVDVFSVGPESKDNSCHESRTLELYPPLLDIQQIVDIIANLSATDGCVLFNRKLQLYSFGGIIELSSDEIGDIRCYRGDSGILLDEAEVRRTFGARRRSALQLCRACPAAMAFVISQDGDLRIFVRDGDKVRFYDRAAYW